MIPLAIDDVLRELVVRVTQLARLDAVCPRSRRSSRNRRWTVYGGLAEIADLPVLEVQDRLYDSSLAQRHRVLLSNGGIDARAPWARDGIDAYKEKLVAEGFRQRWSGPRMAAE
jgi:hypothetical protein